jgi:hypothetical protein
MCFRAHPSYRSASQWHDWALITWESEGESNVYIPGHIVTFLQFTQADINLLSESDYVGGSEAGLYAMVESLVDSLPDSKKGSRIIQLSSKDLSQATPQTYLVPVDSIYEPLAAVPNIGGQEGEYLFLRTADNWGMQFTNYLMPEEEP